MLLLRWEAGIAEMFVRLSHGLLLTAAPTKIPGFLLCFAVLLALSFGHGVSSASAHSFLLTKSSSESSSWKHNSPKNKQTKRPQKSVSSDSTESQKNVTNRIDSKGCKSMLNFMVQVGGISEVVHRQHEWTHEITLIGKKGGEGGYINKYKCKIR